MVFFLVVFLFFEKVYSLRMWSDIDFFVEEFLNIYVFFLNRFLVREDGNVGRRWVEILVVDKVILFLISKNCC